MKIGSLFSGAGGLDMAVEEVFGGEVVWQCEFNEAASKVLAHRYPGVPNFGDVTAIDWDAAEPVDVMCGGYPCQPFSQAGQRKGTDDERHLWPYFAEAIRRVRPRYVVLENVAGHRSMGFDSVLGDLASIGYDAQWCSVRASDAGAPHRRERLFVLAHPALQSGSINDGDQLRARRGTNRPEPDTGTSATPDAPCDGRQRLDDSARRARARVSGFRLTGGSSGSTSTPVELLPTPSVADGDGGHATRSGARSGELLLPGVARAFGNGDLLPTPNASDGSGGGSHPDNRKGHSQQIADYVLLHGTSRWGKYEPAIRRWEAIVGSAPAPTEPNSKGNPRLSAAFPEWMMGWPAGWVTDVPGISRNDQLRIIGNGVVPQAAEIALRYLLSIEMAAA